MDYQVQCCYTDTDGTLKVATKTFDVETKELAVAVANAYFTSVYAFASEDGFKFSRPKPVNASTTIASGYGSVAIGGSATGLVVQTGQNNVSIGRIQGSDSVQIGDTYY